MFVKYPIVVVLLTIIHVRTGAGLSFVFNGHELISTFHCSYN